MAKLLFCSLSREKKNVKGQSSPYIDYFPSYPASYEDTIARAYVHASLGVDIA